MSTCVSLNCPFIMYCKAYNTNFDRGEQCEIQQAIIRQAEKYIAANPIEERIKRFHIALNRQKANPHMEWYMSNLQICAEDMLLSKKLLPFYPKMEKQLNKEIIEGYSELEKRKKAFKKSD